MSLDEQIWTEKYRPQDFGEFFGQKWIVERARAFVSSKNMPHLMFAGPAGTGKSSLGVLIAKKLFGKEWKDNYLELNASDERGIDVIRSKVKDFARTRGFGGGFKILFLDESDALTRDAQNALRRTMENFTQTCRFILSCNFSSKIIDPIQSRCSVFRFRLLGKEEIEEVVKRIAEGEGLSIGKGVIEALYSESEGDCRRVVNILQACGSVDKNISAERVYEVVASVKPQDVRKILESALEGSFIIARELLLKSMLDNGLSGLDIIKAIQKEVWNLELDDFSKVRVIEKVGETEFRLVEGSDEFVQLEALLASLVLFGKK